MVIKQDPNALKKKLKKLKTVILKHESGLKTLGYDSFTSNSEFNPSRRFENISVNE